MTAREQALVGDAPGRAVVADDGLAIVTPTERHLYLQLKLWSRSPCNSLGERVIEGSAFQLAHCTAYVFCPGCHMTRSIQIIRS